MNHSDVMPDESHICDLAYEASALQVCLEQRIVEADDSRLTTTFKRPTGFTPAAYRRGQR